MLSVQVRTMLKGYGNHASQLGYQKRGALPLAEAEMQLLLQSTHKLCNSNSIDTHEQLLLLTDGMLFSLLCQSCFRGFNDGALRLDNIVLPDGEGAIPFLMQSKLQAGAVLHLLPDTTKNRKGGHRKITLSRDVMFLQLASDVHTPLCSCRPAHHQLCHQAIGRWHQKVC